MTLLAIHHITMEFDARPILADISLTVPPAARWGVIGPNGAGKSTLLNILSGTLQPTEGRIYRASRLIITAMEQEPQDLTLNLGRYLSLARPDLQVLCRRLEKLEIQAAGEDPAAGLAYAQALADYCEAGGYTFAAFQEQVAHGLGLPPLDQPLASMSGGERRRAALAKTLLAPADLLLLDEPTNHLDASGRDWLVQHLQRFRGAVLAVSHDRVFLDAFAQHICHVKDNQVNLSPGGYTSWKLQYQRRFLEQQRLYQRQQQEVRRLTEDIRHFRAWGSNRMHRQAASREKQLARLTPAEQPAAPQEIKGFTLTALDKGKRLLDVQGLTLEAGGKRLLEQVSFRLEAGQKLALTGPNGCGKTTLLRTIVGELPPQQGTIEAMAELRIGYYSQDIHFEEPMRTITQEVMAVANCSRERARARLAGFLFPGERHSSPIHQLSPGERARLKLLTLVEGSFHLLLLDEPTNHLDLPTVEMLERALRDFPGAVLSVSHDRNFLQTFTKYQLQFRGQKLLQKPLVS